MRPWSILAPGVAILGETTYVHGTYQLAWLPNFAFLQWDVLRAMPNVAKNCRSTCRVSSEGSGSSLGKTSIVAIDIRTRLLKTTAVVFSLVRRVRLSSNKRDLTPHIRTQFLDRAQTRALRFTASCSTDLAF